MYININYIKKNNNNKSNIRLLFSLKCNSITEFKLIVHLLSHNRYFY